jgi:hypothetical protein
MGNPDAGRLDLTDIFPQDYDFGDHSPLINIAPIPENVSTLIDAGFFSLGHFQNLFRGCVGDSVRQESV